MTVNKDKKIKAYMSQGSIIIYTVLVMFVVITISTALLRLVLPKYIATREAVYSMVALYAADSGIELCVFSNRNDPSVEIIPTRSQLLGSYVTSDVDIQIIPDPCPYGGNVDFRTVGTYRGISRSLEVF